MLEIWNHISSGFNLPQTKGSPLQLAAKPNKERVTAHQFYPFCPEHEDLPPTLAEFLWRTCGLPVKHRRKSVDLHAVI